MNNSRPLRIDLPAVDLGPGIPYSHSRAMATAQGPGLTGRGDVPCAMMATITLPPAPRRGINASARLAPGDIAKRKHRVRIGQPVCEQRTAAPVRSPGVRQSVPQCRCRGKADSLGSLGSPPGAREPSRLKVAQTSFQPSRPRYDLPKSTRIKSIKSETGL